PEIHDSAHPTSVFEPYQHQFSPFYGGYYIYTIYHHPPYHASYSTKIGSIHCLLARTRNCLVPKWGVVAQKSRLLSTYSHISPVPSRLNFHLFRHRPYPSTALSSHVDTIIANMPLADQAAATKVWALTLSQHQLQTL